MAEIPSRKVLPSGRAGVARFSLDIARTGQEQIGAGLAAFGAGVGNLGISLARIDRAEGIAQAQSARNSGTTLFETLKLELEDNNQPRTYQTDFDETLKEIQKLRPSNSTGAKRFDAWFVDQSDAWRTEITARARAKVILLGKGAYITNKAASIGRLDPDETNLIIDEAESAGFITPAQAAKDRLTVESDVEKQLIAVLVNQGKFDEAEELIDNSTRLTVSERLSLKGNIREFKKEQDVKFGNELHDSFIEADSRPLTSAELRSTADDFRTSVTENALLDGTTKTKMLKAIKTWEKDEGSINYPVINSLNQRIDQFVQSGVKDITLRQDIQKAKFDGSFGSRKGIVNRDSAIMLKRLDGAEYRTNYASTGIVRAEFKQAVKDKLNADELMYLFDKDLREEFAAKELNEAQSFQFAQTRATWYKNLSRQQTKELVGIRAEGKDLIPWMNASRADQERDLFVLDRLKPRWWQLSGTEIQDGWTKGDALKAQEIWGDNNTVTDKMIKEFGDYLAEKGKPRFTAGSRLPVVTDDAKGNATFKNLPSGAVFQDSEGNKHRKN